MHTIVTHNGAFDPDDVLAVATLQLYLGVENTKIIRSRDESIIAQGDFVVDVGGIYDPKTRRFDHHQNDVPVRDTGVPYSALGLVWQEYGGAIAGDEATADDIERRLIQPIDSADNHQTVCHPGIAGLAAFELFDVIDSFKPLRENGETYDIQFEQAVHFGRTLITRLIAHSKSSQKLQQDIRKHYESKKGSAVLVFDYPVPRHALVPYREVQVIVAPVPAEGVANWMAAVVPVQSRGFQNRALFPEKWAGLTDTELSLISNIEGAVFCHKERYIFIADSKAGAIKASHHALY